VALDPERAIVSHQNDTTHVAFQFGYTVGLFDFGNYEAQYLHFRYGLTFPSSWLHLLRYLHPDLSGQLSVMGGWLSLTHIGLSPIRIYKLSLAHTQLPITTKRRKQHANSILHIHHHIDAAKEVVKHG
jgi:hypothetical protein